MSVIDLYYNRVEIDVLSYLLEGKVEGLTVRWLAEWIYVEILKWTGQLGAQIWWASYPIEHYLRVVKIFNIKMQREISDIIESDRIDICMVHVVISAGVGHINHANACVRLYEG